MQWTCLILEERVRNIVTQTQHTNTHTKKKLLWCSSAVKIENNNKHRSIDPEMNPSRIHSRKKRRRRRDGNELFLFLFIQSWWFTVTTAEDEKQDSSSSSSQQQQIQDEKYGQDHGLLASARYCRKREVEVTRVTLTCDSPGAYYYGSKTYRNSEVCVDGDKVNLKVHCKRTTMLACMHEMMSQNHCISHHLFVFS